MASNKEEFAVVTQLQPNPKAYGHCSDVRTKDRSSRAGSGADSRVLLVRPPRDTRLDLVRGWLQVTIFVSHVGAWASTWLIHGAWGFSDSSEQFVLLSGLVLGSVFTFKQHRDGWRPAVLDMFGRAARLWRTRALAMLGFGAMIILIDRLWLPGEAVPYHYDYLMAAPLRALATAAVMLYSTAYFDVLVVFICGMLALPLFVLVIRRVGAWGLLLPGALWMAVQVWHLPAPDLARNSPVAFNVLAWQFLFLLGVYLGRRKLLTGWALPRSRWLTAAAGLIVAAGLLLRLNDYGMLHLGLPAVYVNGNDKLDLSPLRLLHALALATLVARLTPADAAWMHGRWPVVLASLGRHSLNVFCAGVFLSYGVRQALDFGGSWLEAPLLLGGIALLAVYARWRDGVRWQLVSLAPLGLSQRHVQ